MCGMFPEQPSICNYLQYTGMHKEKFCLETYLRDVGGATFDQAAHVQDGRVQLQRALARGMCQQDAAIETRKKDAPVTALYPCWLL